MVFLRCLLVSYSVNRIVLQPTWGLGDDVMAAKDRLDSIHVRRRDGPAQPADVLLHFSRAAETHQACVDGGIAERPAECELRQALAVLRRHYLEFLDCMQVSSEMILTEHSAEQVEAAQNASL